MPPRWMPQAEIPVGEHPNAMMLSADGARLFVACANTNAVWVIDVASRTAKEQIAVALYPQAPVGTTPNALALSPDGQTLLVANADNNTVAVVDVENPARSEVEGFIPTGWYPTAVTFDKSRQEPLRPQRQGADERGQPAWPVARSTAASRPVHRRMLQGALTVLPVPDKDALAAMTKRVYCLTRYSDARRLAPPEAPKVSPIPSRVGDRSPIKHVFYVIRENRTYDQVFGDIATGNGDPNLVLFGEDVTPNAHALATQFVLFDNFYVDAEVSYDGHAFSTGAYATDIVEKMWPTNYGGRGGLYLSEGQWKMRGAVRQHLGAAEGLPLGLRDSRGPVGAELRRVRVLGEEGRRGEGDRARPRGARSPDVSSRSTFDPGQPARRPLARGVPGVREGRQPAAAEHPAARQRSHRGHAARRLDAARHGGGERPRASGASSRPSRRAATGTSRRSSSWKTTRRTVPDHVDAHRSVALVVSPFAKRRAVDSTLYTTSGMLRTIELILGLEPMSQYDAAATPDVQRLPEPAGPDAVHAPPGARLDRRAKRLDQLRRAGVLEMNFEEVDMAPELELNEIIWKSIKGAHSPMPPPRRAAFIRPVEGEEEEEER